MSSKAEHARNGSHIKRQQANQPSEAISQTPVPCIEFENAVNAQPFFLARNAKAPSSHMIVKPSQGEFEGVRVLSGKPTCARIIKSPRNVTTIREHPGRKELRHKV